MRAIGSTLLFVALAVTVSSQNYPAGDDTYVRRGVFRVHPKGEHCFAVDAPGALP